MEPKLHYTIWDWYDAPSNIRCHAPWDKGTRVVRVEPGYTFPHNEVLISEHPDWDVHVEEIGGVNYTFIRDENNIPFPEHDGNWFNGLSKTSSNISTVFSKIDGPPVD